MGVWCAESLDELSGERKRAPDTGKKISRKPSLENHWVRAIALVLSLLGSILAESIPGVRTSFYITLPAADVQSKTPAVFPVHSER